MRIRAAFVAAALAICGTALAETLQMPPDERATDSDTPAMETPGPREGIVDDSPLAPAEPYPDTEQPADLTVPVRGMSMEAVENRFGAPLEKLAPVGEPPITRWVYPD